MRCDRCVLAMQLPFGCLTCLLEHLPVSCICCSGTHPTPQLATASAVCWGSRGSSGGGVLAVLTAQNLQPRVQVSPISMMVAVAVTEQTARHRTTTAEVGCEPGEVSVM